MATGSRPGVSVGSGVTVGVADGSAVGFTGGSEMGVASGVGVTSVVGVPQADRISTARSKGIIRFIYNTTLLTYLNDERMFLIAL